MTRIWKVLLIAAMLALFGLLAGAPAYASPYTANEIGYLLTLDEYGVRYSTPAAAVKAGYSICDYLEAHPTNSGVRITLGLATKAGYSLSDSSVIVGAAVRWLDPALLPVIERFLIDNGFGYQTGKMPVLR